MIGKSFQWVYSNMDLVFLVYGASFFLLGITILAQSKRGSTFQIANILWLLAVFGLIHGANEWLEMWKITHGTNLPIKLLGLFCLLLSYSFLFEFGRRLMVITSTKSPVWQQKLAGWLSWKVYGLLISGILLAGLINDNPWVALNIWCRYLLGFTGALLTGIGFLLYYHNEEERLTALQLKPYFIWTTFAFVIYGIASGLVVPAADYFPANRLNYDVFLATTQLPVQVFRAAAAVLAAFAVTKILKMFRWETDYRLENTLKQAQNALKEVEQLSRRNMLILAASGNGILGVDIQGTCSFANPAALKMLGYDEQQFIGQSIHVTVYSAEGSEKSHVPNEHPILEAVREGRAQQVEDTKFLRSDGSAIAVEYQVMPIREKGELIGAVITFQDINERKQAEEQLIKLSRAVEQSPVSIVITDKEGDIEYVNPKFSKITGYSYAEAIGKNPRILKSGHQPLEFYRELWQTITSGKQWDGELLNKKKNGEIFWEKASISPVINKNGDVTNFVAIKEDITQRKKMEDEIRSSMQHLRLYRDQAPLGAIEWDSDFRIVDWNTAAEKIFGFTFEEVKGRNPLEFLVPENVVGNVEQIWNTLIMQTSGEVSINENLTKDGRIILCEWHNTTLINKSGNVIGAASIVQDITERYQAEQSLKRVNRSLHALSACNEVLVRAADEEELLNKVCHIIVEITGYRMAWVGFAEHDEAKSIRPVAQAGYEEGYIDTVKLTWDDTERGQGPTGTAIRTGMPRIIHNIREAPRYVEWVDSALEQDYHSSIALPLKNKEQAFGALNIYAREEDAFDEDEIRLLQELANDLAYGIVTLRSHRERHQLNKQLQQAQKMEAIGQLTGGIAHDFNNILASILGFTNLALQRYVGDDQPKLRNYLNEVARAGERARDLVSQMLAFSRTSSSKPSPLQLSPMAKEVTKMLQATLPSSIELSSQIDADVPTVIMDPVHMQQVLMNMCINARDAIGDKGRINIRARRVRINNSEQHTAQTSPYDAVLHHICDACHNQIEEGDYVELSVQDTGSGISDDKVKQIFEPFFTTKEVGKGSGMGLSMVHGIVHQHGGHILLDTQPGVGTTFRLLFPVRDDVSDYAADVELNTNLEVEGLHNEHILVVDDEESVAMFIGDLLESHGGDVTVMTDSLAALDLFSQDPTAFDLIITDQTMPKLTGVELAQKLLALRPDLPVILCTGYSEKVNEVKAKALGIRGYIAKPMESDVLVNLVQSLID